MRIWVFPAPRKGKGSLAAAAGRAIRGLGTEGGFKDVTIGENALPAIQGECRRGEGMGWTCTIIGVNGKKGFTVRLETTEEGDRRLFRKVLACAWIPSALELKDALRRLPGVFEKAVERGDDPAAEEALGRLCFLADRRSVVSALMKGLEAESAEVRLRTIEALGIAGGARAVPCLERILFSPCESTEFQAACIRALARIGGRRARKALERKMKMVAHEEGRERLRPALRSALAEHTR